MKLTEVLNHIEKMNPPIIETQKVSKLLNVEDPYANRLLNQLNKSGHLVKVKRGLWAIPGKVSFLMLPEYLTAPFPAYVSLQTALYCHNMIDQIPSVTYAVTKGKTKRYLTPLGDFSMHHLQPSFFFGFETVGSTNIKMATPEKALLDVLYLSPTKSKLFHALPELSLPEKFSIDKAKEMIEVIGFPRRRTLVKQKFYAIMEKVTF